ncbi:L-alanine-DL-glutamate epimerase-like enolase superfamily enzyme [Haloactinopolyspora alba]|uniref:L-alanine-DL-glutamate epimerase-like enolase superfamily enzyme n=1 Tax=Haloactinopolyspora alba TaxID=648780 RepID=A0A2P8D3W6_9ACTN|nr:enolase C-terminal domain-like protein [Haloactinopolyspora alba]PSK91869.1 L-alanine-DL-glutamate epimerase-like enolase superfamily enzyme [Haloactinopolyspora alba]
MTTTADVTVDSVRAAAYVVPTDAPEADGTLAWNSTTLVVCDVVTGPVTGLGYTYADASCVPLIESTLAPLVTGRDALDVTGTWSTMQRGIRNLGRPGLVSCALSAVETALYDAKARLLDVALASLFGRAHETVPIYGSGGFTSYDDDTTRRGLDHWVHEERIPRVKIKVGESWGTRVRRDLHRVALARHHVGDEVELYVDANGAYGVGQAARVGRELAEHGVTWYEEPVSSDHLAGLRQVRQQVTADVTAGEYGYHLPYFAGMLGAEAVDCLQIDVTRCGGYGEWLRAAACAAGRSTEISGHCAPNLSAHVATATPNVRHLEYFHDHERIERMLFDGALSPTDGALRPDPTRPGHGLSLKHADAERYRVP